jgi:4-hydroxy-tetrahydrodipicolinate reductase
MGQRVIAAAFQASDLQLAGAYESASSPKLNADAGTIAGVGPIGVPITADVVSRVDVIIDFSTPEGTAAIAEVCASRQIPLVVATTGLHGPIHDEVLSASQVTALLMSPSMSLAVNVAMQLSRVAGQLLRTVPDGVDVEIIERHHRFKEDAPSGTALRFGEIIASEMGQTSAAHGRQGRPGQRPKNEIGYHAVRTGDNVGEHSILFGLLGESIELTVRSHSRDSYALGALAAARFLVGKPAGLYSMSDVLGL